MGSLQFFTRNSLHLLNLIFISQLSDMLVRTLVLIVLPFVVLNAAVTLNLALLGSQELARHNAYRAKYKYPALTLNTTLVRIAQSYSSYLYTKLALIHSAPAMSGKYGENLAWKWGAPSLTYVGGSTSNGWYSESANYANWASKNGKDIYHFTAMIWKSVKTVGFGFYQGNQTISGMKGFGIYVVANYYPTPNVAGQYKTNLPQYA